jgi:hypothetical protein
MKIRLLLMVAWLAATFFVVLSPVDIADAGRGGRGGGGGGGGRSFSRSGPAAHGGFSGGASQRTASRQVGMSERAGQRSDLRQQRTTDRSDVRTNRQDQITDRQGQRQEYGSQRQENRQDYRSEAREDWQDAANDNWDNRYYRYPAGAAVATGAVVAAGAYAVGAAANNVTYVTTLPCSPTTAYLDGVTYYRCGSAWYTRAYSGGNVSYLVANPPPGY